MATALTAKQRVAVALASLVGAIVGLLLTIPIGSVIVDCFPPAASPECGSFEQSVLVKTTHPYPHWIPVVGTLVGALVFGLAAWAFLRRRQGSR
jgi:hypothetical protein